MSILSKSVKSMCGRSPSILSVAKTLHVKAIDFNG